MKKNILIYALLILLLSVVTFTFFYEKPILTTYEATKRAEEILKNPPEGWEKANLDVGLKVTPENIIANLIKREGRFFNRYKWEITVIYNGKEPTVVIDAYSGKFIEIYGPLS
ncbi:PepSY domain-containing protein [Sporosarcina thermotolerans]|uniref:PepSY domain-containing protein n=1 Tax=Sporosarcina thermotolerans TaxID=633404 RepID=A0AAW9A8M6_9BACL|nr:PepSY domain-containing protein [Sporosarcina thermotolerans]MDW0117547.1 PepSY domain-containing protein [Sporosarcina thermotolerans]WHT49708.1 PepSY domain-containing protein [Sporosarcina thermotolerans]